MDVVVPEVSPTESVLEKAKHAVERQSIESSPSVETRPESRSEQNDERKSELFYQKILTQVKSGTQTVQSDSDAKSDAQDIAALTDADAQAAKLTDLAGTRGVVYAVKVARMLDFYILDTVHDQLANSFYDALVEKGMIEKE